MPAQDRNDTGGSFLVSRDPVQGVPVG